VSASPGVLVDAHVHFYTAFDAARFVTAAAENFRATGRQLGIPEPLGYLLFTEAAGQRHFDRFRRGVDRGGFGPLEVRSTAEPCALTMWRDDKPVLVLVEGRQVKSAEGLEVLAPASREEFPDGRPLVDTWAMVRDSGALPILPWGFGKWWFGRGQLMHRLVTSARAHELYLGDGKGRPAAGMRPSLFAAAAERGILNLPGTDPFPFPGHASRAGSFGFVTAFDVDLDAPAASLVRHVRGLSSQPRTYGRGESLLEFFVSQTALRLATARPATRPDPASMTRDPDATRPT
jgi:hypothetical protein